MAWHSGAFNTLSPHCISHSLSGEFYKRRVPQGYLATMKHHFRPSHAIQTLHTMLSFATFPPRSSHFFPEPLGRLVKRARYVFYVRKRSLTTTRKNLVQRANICGLGMRSNLIQTEDSNVDREEKCIVEMFIVSVGPCACFE